MNDKKIRIGIIGTGIIGKRHIEWYEKIDGAEIIAICDVNKQELERVAKDHSISRTFADYNEMLKLDDIDAVDICLHANLHANATIRALEAGKHVYCEKPIAGSYVDGKKMIDTAKKHGKMLQVQLSQTVFTKETQTAKILIDADKLGKVYHARSTGYRRRGRCYVDGYGTPSFVQKKVCGGGALFDRGVYFISRLMYLLDNPDPVRISGKTYQEIDMDPILKKESGYDVEELAVGFVRLEGDITLDIIESWAINLDEFEASSLAGSKGGIRFNPLTYFTNLNNEIEMDSTFSLERMKLHDYEGLDKDSIWNLSQPHWIDSLKGKVEPIPTAEIALKTMLIQEGVYLSDKLGREVTAEEVIENSVSTAI